MAYIIKAYDYDGKFYGYFAPHPDDLENKSFSFYEDDVKLAKQFNSYIEASNMVERFQDGSDLEYIIINYNPNNGDLHDFIKQWVAKHYGESEANNPSWNIESLANAITEYLNNK